MNPYDKQNFLGCHDCGVLQPLISDWRGWPAEAIADASNAFDAFVATHRSHCTARLHRHRSDAHSDRPLADPMATIAFEVTDGEHVYLVRSTRQSIEEARAYRFAPGTLTVQNTEAGIDADDFRRGLDLAFHPHALRPSKVDRFLAVLHEIVSKIQAAELEIAFDVADEPALGIARMPEAVYQELLARCAEIFDPWECSRVREFLAENRDADGLLALRVSRQADLLIA